MLQSRIHWLHKHQFHLQALQEVVERPLQFFFRLVGSPHNQVSLSDLRVYNFLAFCVKACQVSPDSFNRLLYLVVLFGLGSLDGFRTAAFLEIAQGFECCVHSQGCFLEL